jgi:hypothetical protein
MNNAPAIAALTTLARSDTLDATVPALAQVRALLGEDAPLWKPLLETLALRAQQIADLKRRVRAQTSLIETQRRSSYPPAA